MAAEALLAELRQQCDPENGWPARVADEMVREMVEGLAVQWRSKVKMLLSFVDVLPTGDEEGLFYALDLGGTNFRVLRVLLGGKEKGIVKRESRQVSIPPHLMSETSAGLFGFIASELAKFVDTEEEEHRLPEGRQRELGFTFSFPVRQSAIDSGILIKWTKAFDIEDAVGKDIVVELHTAMKKLGFDMRVAALINDAVGALAGGRYYYEDVVASVIVGTGTNAAYIERADAIPKLSPPLPKSGNMVINMEWGNFDSPALPVTEYDRKLDEESVNSGQQIYEKMVSGMYLGEIVRQFLVKMATETSVLGGVDLKKLKTYQSLTTHDMSIMHCDDTPELQNVANTLAKLFGIKDTSLDTRKVIVEVCDIIVKRAAILAAAGMFAILKKLGRDGRSRDGKPSVIVVDGGLYTRNMEFRNYLEGALNSLLGKEAAQLVSIKTVKDGSGTGAALIAATHSQYRASSGS